MLVVPPNKNFFISLLVYMLCSQYKEVNCLIDLDIFNSFLPFGIPFQQPISQLDGYTLKPLVIESEGKDKNGNSFYEKEILFGSGNRANSNNMNEKSKFRGMITIKQKTMNTPMSNSMKRNFGSSQRLPFLQFKVPRRLLKNENNNVYPEFNDLERFKSSQIPSTSSGEIYDDLIESTTAPYQQDDENNFFENFLESILLHKPNELEEIRRENEIKASFNQIDNSNEPNIHRKHQTIGQQFQSISPIFHQPIIQQEEITKKSIPPMSQLEADLNMLNNHPKILSDIDANHADQLRIIEENLIEKEQDFINAVHHEKLKGSNDLINNQKLRTLNQNGQYELVDSSYIYIKLDQRAKRSDAETLLKSISKLTSIPLASFDDISIDENLIFFKVIDSNINTNILVTELIKHQEQIEKETGLKLVSTGIGRDEQHRIEINKHPLLIDSKSRYFILTTIIVCVSILSVLITLIAIFLIRRRVHLRRKLVDDVSSIGKGYDDEERLVKKGQSCESGKWSSVWPFSKLKSQSCNKSESKKELSPSQDYQELCRQRMQSKNSSPLNSSIGINSTNDTPGGLCSPGLGNSSAINSTPIRITSVGSSEGKSESNRSSTSSWSEEPISTVNMDITTGHVILSYMEEHLNDKNRLSKEWQDLADYEPDTNKAEIGSQPQNMTKNRYSNILPYDHTRVKLGDNKDNDYINANFIIDNDPKNPAYIATQGPLIHTTSEFWQMIWEQSSVVIISLCRTIEYGSLKCNQFWPVNGCEVYEKFEVHLVSEHVWCEDYLVRSFYLKNLETNLTRTVTQFHYLTWPENGVPHSIKSLLDFRRKVNKSYKSKSSPTVVHCNDGIGRTGTYILIDMILNKIAKGAKEIDLAATLEFLRDQRPGMVKSKNQFEFSFAVITEEVQNMLKALGQ